MMDSTTRVREALTWGMPLAVLVLVGLVVWWFGRRQNWREHPKPLPAILPTLGR